jgi:hypothetical protein
MKKRLLSAALAVSIALLLGSCELILGSSGGGGDDDDATTRTFYAQNILTGTWYRTSATLRATGDKCLIYVEDDQLDTVSATLAQAIADEFDADIYAKIQTNFGTESDVDENGKIILFLLDIQDGYPVYTGGGYVAGYFDPTHLFDSSSEPYSNEADMLYMDVYPAEAGDADFNSTIAHEFQHLINFATTFSAGFGYKQQDVWINEGLSAAAEYVYAGAQVQARIDWYNDPPTTDPDYSDIENGNNFFVWGENDNYILDEYATVYLFFQWLRIHASNDSGIYKEILNNPNKYVDYRTVTAAASLRIDAGLSDWDVLLRTWLAANVLNLSSGPYGYGGEIATIVTQRVTADSPLSPGEGVYFNVSSFDRTATGNLRYAGINTSTEVVDAVGTNYEGDVGLVLNVNTVKTGLAETGDVASIAIAPTKVSSVRASSRSAGALKPPSAYPISVILQPGGGFHPDSHRPAGSTAPSRELDTSARIIGSRR